METNVNRPRNVPRESSEAIAEPVLKKQAPKWNEAADTPTEESQEQYTWFSKILHDHRTPIVFGLAILFVAIGLFFAFLSYLFTWQTDQNIVSGHGLSIIFNAADNPVENWFGIIGAWVANAFIYGGFGIASFAWVFILLLLGYRFVFAKHFYSLQKGIAYSLFFLVFVSISFGFLVDVFKSDYQFLAGTFGLQSAAWLSRVIGRLGTAGILAFVGLSFLVIVYNIDFHFFTKSPIVEEDEAIEEQENISAAGVANSRKNSPKYDLEEYAVNDTPFEIDNAEDDMQEDDNFPIEEPVLLTNEHNAAAGETVEMEVEPMQKHKPTAIEDIEMEVAQSPVQEEVVQNNAGNLLKPVYDDPVFADTDALAASLVAEQGPYNPRLDLPNYIYPTLDLLNVYENTKKLVTEDELQANKKKIIEVLNNFSIGIAKIKATVGPTVTLYEIIPDAGVRISKIKNLEDDIALALAALGIRIIAPIPGKGTIGIEVPNLHPEMVPMRSILASEAYKNTTADLPIALGKNISDEIFIGDLAKMPHLLMAGATGQGKSVGINAILASLLYKKHPAELKFVLVDPKKVELTLFKKIERHFLAILPGEEEAIITDNKKVINTLNSLCIEMDKRYELLKDAQVRNIKEYNEKFVARKLNPENGHRFLPYIVLVVDEFADLMMTAGKEVETPIARLAQLARAIGIHLIIATQRPSVNIITGTIKANFPARIAFRVTSKIDSRTILDSGGADQLIGRGDMLLSTGNDLIRLQCAYLDTPEVDKVCDFIGNQMGYPQALQLPQYVPEGEDSGMIKDFNADERDEYFEDAARLIVMHQQGSTSTIQRKLKLGYNRAGRIMDQLEMAGIVGPSQGSKARDVLYPDEYSLEQYLQQLKNKE